MFVRGADEMLGLLGGRCVDCGTTSARRRRSIRRASRAAARSSSRSRSPSGSVHTYVVNHTMPAPFVAPLPLAVLDIDDGARLMLQVIGDGSDVEIGRRGRPGPAQAAHERGVPVYGFKARARRR